MNVTHPTAQSATHSPAGESLMCSLVARERGLDPIGTAAGTFEQHLFIEAPLPWTRDALQSPGFPKAFAELPRRAQDRGLPVRVIAVAPDPAYSVAGHTRVIRLRRPADPFAEFLADEWLVPDHHLDAFAEALADSEGEDVRAFEAYRRERDGVRDLLVCTQGSRDACCGKFGYQLYQHLRELGDRGVRVWRSSHLGGHRFAPTMVELPGLRQWAHITPEIAAKILSRSGDFRDVRQHYRGWAGLRSPWEQVLEREVLEREGWDAARYLRSGRVVELSEDGQRARVSICLTLPNGLSKRYDAVVEVAGTISAPESCQTDALTDFPCYRVHSVEVDPADEGVRETP